MRQKEIQENNNEKKRKKKKKEESEKVTDLKKWKNDKKDKKIIERLRKGGYIK